jgi:hypothetical protein
VALRLSGLLARPGRSPEGKVLLVLINYPVPTAAIVVACVVGGAARSAILGSAVVAGRFSADAIHEHRQARRIWWAWAAIGLFSLYAALST